MKGNINRIALSRYYVFFCHVNSKAALYLHRSKLLFPSGNAILICLYYSCLCIWVHCNKCMYLPAWVNRTCMVSLCKDTFICVYCRCVHPFNFLGLLSPTCSIPWLARGCEVLILPLNSIDLCHDLQPDLISASLLLSYFYTCVCRKRKRGGDCVVQLRKI